MRMSIMHAAAVLVFASLPLPSRAESNAPAKKSFKDADADGDQALDRTEWIASGRSEKTFARVDADKDGKVTREEVRLSGQKRAESKAK